MTDLPQNNDQSNDQSNELSSHQINAVSSTVSSTSPIPSGNSTQDINPSEPPRKSRKLESGRPESLPEPPRFNGVSAAGAGLVPGAPNQTLYINNLNDKIRKDELKKSLHMLFSTYGHIISIVALKTPKMRGQAHIAFSDTGSASLALRSLKDFDFFGKPLKIEYAKTKSDAIAKLDGTYKMPPPPALLKATLPLAPFEEDHGVKRAHEEDY